jgi:thiamine biosynthesis protein ThiC
MPHAAWEILRPTMIHPDILDGLIAKRIAIAQQVEKGELTVSQGNEAMAKARSEAAAEEQRRGGSAPGQDAARSIFSTQQ